MIPNILQFLRKAIRTHRLEWEMSGISLTVSVIMKTYYNTATKVLHRTFHRVPSRRTGTKVSSERCSSARSVLLNEQTRHFRQA